MRRAAALALLALAAPRAAAVPLAVPVGVPVAPSTAAVSASSLTIVGITITRNNVFNPAVPGENIWPFQMADKIHFTTKEQVIRQELLLGPGDHWDPLRALESERNLRSLNIFRRAEIRPVNRPDGKLDLDVRTQDSWTTNVQFSIGTEGGDNYLTYGASEDNLFGYGKSVSAIHSQVGPRRRNEFQYVDPRFLGSRLSLNPLYAKTNNGDSISTNLIQPFFALETPLAMGAGWNRTVDETITYKGAEDYSKFLQRSRIVRGAYGFRLEPDHIFAQRIEAGWYADKEEFNATGDTLGGTLPRNREISGPAFGYSWVQPRYVKESYINKMERVEDFNMGNELKVFGGFMGTATGSDRDRWVFNAIDQQGLFLAPGRFVLAQAGATGRVADGKPENTLLFANLNLFWKTIWLAPQTWVSHLEVNKGRNLDLENQVILGGDTGLRGYKNNSFVGGESTLLNLEDRFFFPGEYFHLLRFGGAVFFDSGSVVGEGTGISFPRFKSDVGAGLRVGTTRSQSGNVVRFDLAYALQRGPSGGRFVVSIRGKQAFQIFNSSTRRVTQSPSSTLIVEPTN